jgi:hypothetical protein
MESAPASSANTSERKPLTPDEKKGAIGCLIALAVVVLLSVSFCGRSDNKADATSTEAKLAFLDYGEDGKDPSMIAEYRKLISSLAGRFEITEQQTANMTYSTVKSLKEHGVSTTTLEMLRAAERVSSADSGPMWGKGKENYAYMTASISAQMLPK